MLPRARPDPAAPAVLRQPQLGREGWGPCAARLSADLLAPRGQTRPSSQMPPREEGPPFPPGDVSSFPRSSRGLVLGGVYIGEVGGQHRNLGSFVKRACTRWESLVFRQKLFSPLKFNGENFLLDKLIS